MGGGRLPAHGKGGKGVRGAPAAEVPSQVRHGLARVLSKQGVCSRREAAQWVAAGRVAVDGKPVLDPEFPVVQGRHRLSVDGKPVQPVQRHYLMLNKPRGLVTTAHDEQGRDTVYRCLPVAELPWLAPVGRLDKASEGLLLFSNDPEWAARVTDPHTGPRKTYHVQVDVLADAALISALQDGAVVDGEALSAAAVRHLRQGERTSWLEVELDEGRNRQIRRLLGAFDVGVLRLVRVAVGTLQLGALAKGAWRPLHPQEVRALAAPGRTPAG